MNPLKLFETLACGIPAIVSELPGQADLIREGRCGLVIPCNDPTALARAVAAYRQEDDRGYGDRADDCADPLREFPDAQLPEEGLAHGDGRALTQAEYHAAPREQPAERDDEGGDVSVGDEAPLHCAHDDAHQERDAERAAEPVRVLRHRRDAAREPYDRADREVYLPRDNDHQHPDREHARHGHLL